MIFFPSLLSLLFFSFLSHFVSCLVSCVRMRIDSAGWLVG